jgi:ATP-dependent exoDNAse (exonuclease V) beta subunit
MTTLPDQQARQQALDPGCSFIVQAPAGSGKTELLVQRFLALLARVEREPEEIIAITFTRKAAAEMRQRVLSALEAAQQPCPTESHAQTTWQLAQAVLQRDQASGWCLLDNPGRLRVQTIDALCASLTRQAPILSGLGALNNTVEQDIDRYYRQATQQLLAQLEQPSRAATLLAKLLLHLDNRIDVAENLFVRMLARREQWLPHLIKHGQYLNAAQSRQVLEAGLQHIVAEMLQRCQQQLPVGLQQEIWSLWRVAQENLGQTIAELPRAESMYLAAWQSLAKLLLTDKCEWRLQVDKRHGFPAEDKATKQRMVALLKQLQPSQTLQESLVAILKAPAIAYSDAQWQIIDALIELLPLAVAHLKVLFNEHNVCDFSEIALAANSALGDKDAPTDLTLLLDQQIRHLLVDEFQDTSITQFNLLEKLTAGWQNGDGRTLFLVGDPMQSIYRFRQAEVGLFLKAQQEGLGEVVLTCLTLRANFRSTPAVVDWVNEQFSRLFPTDIDISSGAVTFSPGSATRSTEKPSAIHLHAFAAVPVAAERVAEIVQQAQQEDPQQEIAILVRSRLHLQAIIPELTAANLEFSAVEIDPLAQQSVVQDLLALTGALLHLGDRICWLAILRAPWCGLTLADLYAVAGFSWQKPLWEALRQFQTIPNLSADGQQRLAVVVPILQQALTQRGRLSLRDWVETTWQALQGPACLIDAVELNSCEAYFRLLQNFDRAGVTPDYQQLQEKLARQYASPPTTAQQRLHVMTIHKAKGLEFDTVIIPHLEMKTRGEDEQLLLWLDRPRAGGENDLILAPVKARSEQKDAIYQYLQTVEKTKTRYESTRLLYVAATRAKNNLHWVATIDGRRPSSDSFLAQLWPLFEPLAQQLLGEVKEDATVLEELAVSSLRQHDYRLRRLPLSALLR